MLDITNFVHVRCAHVHAHQVTLVSIRSHLSLVMVSPGTLLPHWLKDLPLYCGLETTYALCWSSDNTTGRSPADSLLRFLPIETHQHYC